MIGGFIRERVTSCGSLKTSLHILWPFLYNKKVDGFVVFTLDGLVMTLTGACSGSDAVRLLGHIEKATASLCLWEHLFLEPLGSKMSDHLTMSMRDRRRAGGMADSLR